jgi:methylated-DNA-[protein]-cysteine S-methyltransferase
VKPQSVTPYRSSTFDSPIGVLKLVASSSGLAAVLWENDDPKRVRLGPTSENATDAILIEARRQLKAYFAGDLKVFTLRLDFRGTEFQKSVWEALLTIPFGETRSYSDIARQIAKPKASRAVGAANGRNPISIIAPCHRVIGSNGALTGFAGGIAAKEYLLRLERACGRKRCGRDGQGRSVAGRAKAESGVRGRSSKSNTTVCFEKLRRGDIRCVRAR